MEVVREEYVQSLIILKFYGCFPNLVEFLGTGDKEQSMDISGQGLKWGLLTNACAPRIPQDRSTATSQFHWLRERSSVCSV